MERHCEAKASIWWAYPRSFGSIDVKKFFKVLDNFLSYLHGCDYRKIGATKTRSQISTIIKTHRIQAKKVFYLLQIDAKKKLVCRWSATPEKNQYVKIERLFDSLFAFDSHFESTFLWTKIMMIWKKYYSFSFPSIPDDVSLDGTSLVNNGSKSTAPNVRRYQLRMLLPSILHCVRHFTTDFIQSQMLSDILENAILYSDIDGNGNIHAGIFEIFAASK